MARSIIQHIPIDAEWAETLVGLRLNIPNRWWPGYDDGGLNRGHIAAIDFNASNTFYFQVELDDEPGAHYAMRYDSVVLYADEEQRGFSRYRLPSPLSRKSRRRDGVSASSQKIYWVDG